MSWCQSNAWVAQSVWQRPHISFQFPPKASPLPLWACPCSQKHHLSNCRTGRCSCPSARERNLEVSGASASLAWTRDLQYAPRRFFVSGNHGWIQFHWYHKLGPVRQRARVGSAISGQIWDFDNIFTSTAILKNVFFEAETNAENEYFHNRITSGIFEKKNVFSTAKLWPRDLVFNYPKHYEIALQLFVCVSWPWGPIVKKSRQGPKFSLRKKMLEYLSYSTRYSRCYRVVFYDSGK